MRDMGMVTAAGGRTTLVEDFRIIKRPADQARLSRSAGAATSRQAT